jgi:hypothetical protein
MTTSSQNDTPLQIGWAEVDITPPGEILITGQLYARVSEGVADPLQATVLVLQSGSEHSILVCCDVVTIPDLLRDTVREKLRTQLPQINPMHVVLNATHTHAGPDIRPPSPIAGHTTASGSGVDLDVTPPEEAVEFVAERIADAIGRAWSAQATGGIAYGMDYAVVGRNRRWVDDAGRSTMYGLTPQRYESFRHIEGYEDHSLNLLATYDATGVLSGLVMNIPCPSQVSEHWFQLSADYWCETRRELRERFGSEIFILAQCSAAGDLSPHTIYEREANARMLELRGRTEREEIAQRIADAVGRILPYIEPTRESTPPLVHRVETLQLPANDLTEADVEDALKAAALLQEPYETEIAKLEAAPKLREQPRWYVPATRAYQRRAWHLRVAARYEHQKTHPTIAAEVHVLRLGDIIFAINPFEYYLDFGIQIKVRCPAIQTFLVQLAGPGTYVPSPRSVQGGGYGSVPASNPVGPQGGQVLAEETLRLIHAVWPKTETV